MDRTNKSINELVICSDFDDTINELLPAWLKWLNEHHNLSVRYEDVTGWDMTKFFPTLTPNQIYEPLHLQTFWETVPMKTDAEYYIKKLINEGVKFYIATNTSHKTLYHKMESCLLPNLPFLNKSVITIVNKQLLKCDIMIDDGIFNLEGGDYIKVLMDAPHNRNSNNVEDFRVTNWKEIYDLVHQIVNVASEKKPRKQWILHKLGSFRYAIDTYIDGVLLESVKLWEGDELCEYIEKMKSDGFERAYKRSSIQKALDDYKELESMLLVGE